ncbi:MAG: class I SAM-dependent methyltransferase [Dehalococcoidia bacterium]
MGLTLKRVRVVLARMTPRAIQKNQHVRRLRGRVARKLLRYRVRHGFRLVPEEAFSSTLLALVSDLSERQQRLGDYLEFGVFNGTSLACAHQVLDEVGQGHVRFFGFDSFQGMPRDAATEDGGVWMPGALWSDLDFTREFLTEHGVDWNRTVLVEGWFSDTLNDETRERLALRETSVVMIDCDLYSSALAALRFVRPLLADEAVILFDDWYSVDLSERLQGEARALAEFEGEAPEFEFTPAGSYSRTSNVVRVRRLIPRGGVPARPG